MNEHPERERVIPDFADFQDPRKLFHHIDRVYELATTGDTRPIHMTIGLTNYCNHKCPWCYINWHQAGGLAKRSGAQEVGSKRIDADDRLIRAVTEAAAMGLKAVTIVGDGEPTLHPRFVQMLEAIAATGVQIGIFTNFSTKDPEVLEALLKHCFFVRGSVDAASAEAHRLSHGSADWDLVVGNMRRMVQLRADRRPPILGVQYVTNHDNFRELPAAARFYRDLGFDYMTIKPAYKNVLNPAHSDNQLKPEMVFPLMREAEAEASERFRVYAKYPQFQEVLSSPTNDGVYYRRCMATPLSPYLDEDGAVEMCGNLKGRGFTMGSILETSFTEIWNSERRKDCLSRIDLSQCPAGCKLDPLNKVLWDAMNPDELTVHPNFI